MNNSLNEIFIKKEPIEFDDGIEKSRKPFIKTEVLSYAEAHLIKNESNLCLNTHFEVKTESENYEVKIKDETITSDETNADSFRRTAFSEPLVKIECLDQLEESSDPLDVSTTQINGKHFLDVSTESEIDSRVNDEEEKVPKESYLTNEGLQDDQKQVVQKRKKVMCQVCNKIFGCKSNLNKHMRIHSGVKPFVCDVCEKLFTQLSHLESHRLIHTGNRPHVCDLCGQAFTHKSHLVNHKLIHAGQKPHLCNFCQRSFTRRPDLVKHIRIHTGERPHVCNICQKTFAQNSVLVDHLRIHNSEKPHVCEICNKGFIKKSYLDRHKTVHTGEKPHTCDVCNKSFGQKYSLLRHKQSHIEHHDSQS